ncbi:MAG: hypothetical protein L0271_19700 [Gemmatimonadetes bacterium]|nr:hypothetical protein [Gemmatimonadota bacterium]
MRMQARREGMALVMVLVVLLAVGALVGTASLMGSSALVMATQDERLSSLIAGADAGIEEGRAILNGDTIYPDSGYVTLENGVAVVDASGNTVPGLKRWTYAGPTGITTGQYGVFGSVVSVVEDANGDRIIRRQEVYQESFAKYAYFTDIDFSANIWFGGGDQLFGPVHSNDSLGIHSTGATFHSTVTTAKYIVQKPNGTYNDVVTENGLRIPMPNTTDLNKLRNYALAGSTRIVSNNNGGADQAETRIEFIAIDLDGDGSANGKDEGFFRVYQSSNEAWVSADVPGTGLTSSDNCGDANHASHSPSSSFKSASQHSSSGTHTKLNSLTAASRRCYLGGADQLFNGFTAADAIGPGNWLAWPGTVDPRLTSPPVSRPDANYLWPLSRAINPNFKGVIFVDGKVMISGTLRGRITLAATSNIIIGDDIRYATNPSLGTCADIMGLFSGTDVVVADNSINSPSQPSGSGSYYTYDDTRDEFIDGVVLALDNFTAHNYNTGSSSAEPCGTTTWGRGCLYLKGGIIQRQRGAVGLVSGQGYLKRYDYDQCAFSDPPPYFPTTGHFARGRYFEVDATGFNVASYYKLLSGGTP